MSGRDASILSWLFLVLARALVRAACAVPVAVLAWSSSNAAIVEIPIEEYTRNDTTTLRGVDSRLALVFGLRSDQSIKELFLDLTYSYSPALLKELSHVNVLLNDHFVQTIQIDKEGSDNETGHARIALPASELQKYNTLELQLIAHYTLQCEDPLHKDLWFTVQPESKLVFDIQPRVLGDELGLLPAPFFEAQDLLRQEARFVLPQVTDQRLEAAGMLASWFGALSSFRGMDVSIHSSIPAQGHSIAILGANESLPGIKMPAVTGPTVAIRSNPNNPADKILIVTGRDEEEIRQAAVALSLGAQTLSGSEVALAAPKTSPRKPYDAPNWIDTSRAVAIGELLPNLKELTVNGFDPYPIRIGLRIPPDLSPWRKPSVPLRLRTYYSVPESGSGNDVYLSIFLNDELLERIDLEQDFESLRQRLTSVLGVKDLPVYLPVEALRFFPELKFKFEYPEPARAECSGVFLDPRFSSIDPDSVLDFQNTDHQLAMPDLAAFRTALFPFTRMADLSETAVILNENPSTVEIEAYLTIMGKIGQITGYPGTGIAVSRNASGLSDKDLLVIQTSPDQGLMKQWSKYMPKPSSGPDQTWFDRFLDLINLSTGPSSSRTVGTIGTDDAVLAGFESPVTDNRSVIVISAPSPAKLLPALNQLLLEEKTAHLIQGSLVASGPSGIRTLSRDTTYHVGNLSYLQNILWLLSNRPVYLWVIFIVATILVSMVCYMSLRTRAQRRLMIGSDQEQPRNRNK